MTIPTHLPKPLIPLNSPEVAIETVGGKAINLVKLVNAGFPVPNGFLIPTMAYRQFVVQNDITQQIKDSLQDLDSTSPKELAAASKRIRARFNNGSLSPELVAAIQAGWRWLGARPVAVRSSATAEDLPDLSFAGQQDTFLNVLGDEALVKAVVACWSSLWTARAIGYRARNNIAHDEVALSVVVQNMIPSQASGVLFTANPLTGLRSETVIDATLGLGEALVSGRVEPDHYMVDTQNQAITHKTLGSKSIQISAKPAGGTITQESDAAKEQAIPDQVILQLAEIGQKIETLYHFPQDIEWAWVSDADSPNGNIHILQSRPITSLFPLPGNLPFEPLKVLIGFHTVQGILEPLTPLGMDTMKLVLTGGGQVFGLNISLAQQTAFYTAAERLWINVTPIIRHPIAHKNYPKVIRAIDPGVAEATQKIVDDPRLSPTRSSFSHIRRRDGIRFLLRMIREVSRFMRNPESRRDQLLADIDSIYTKTRARLTSSGDIWTDFTKRMTLLNEAKNIFSDFVVPRGVPGIIAGMASFFGILERLSKQVYANTGDQRFKQIHLEISRGLPYNVTTEMDLKLWQVAQTLRDDPDSIELFEHTAPQVLTTHFLNDTLPAAAQRALAQFMEIYGMRGLGEIDIGRPRWREDPSHIVQILQSYLQIDDPDQSPDSVFERGAKAAEKAGILLESEVGKLPFGHIKARMVNFGIKRYRALGGLREAPKFFAIRMMGIIRQGLLQSGLDFVNAGLLEQADDLFFLYIHELNELAGRQQQAKAAYWAQLREQIANRRALRGREMKRAQIPRVLLSNGTAFYEGVTGVDDNINVLRGDPVSPGIVEGPVKVVLNPLGTQLEPGEILVCPGTDPAWTPLFLAAGGLVMEVGGMMTHGSVVAREYGIPAVVGVHQATSRLQTGDRIRVDGSSGIIEVL